MKQFKHGLKSYLLFYLSHNLSCNLSTNLRCVRETGPRWFWAHIAQLARNKTILTLILEQSSYCSIGISFLFHYLQFICCSLFLWQLTKILVNTHSHDTKSWSIHNVFISRLITSKWVRPDVDATWWRRSDVIKRYVPAGIYLYIVGNDLNRIFLYFYIVCCACMKMIRVFAP